MAHHLSQSLCVVQWNETIKLFRGGMPLRRHWANFRYYDWSFTGSEAVDYLHELLRRNHNFGPEVTRYQTLQLLRKFLKAHVIEDIKGRHGTEDFEDNGHLYRYDFCLHYSWPLFMSAIVNTPEACAVKTVQHIPPLNLTTTIMLSSHMMVVFDLVCPLRIFQASHKLVHTKEVMCMSSKLVHLNSITRQMPII